MIETISEEIVESVWREVSDLDPFDALDGMEKLGEEQPLLLAFVSISLEELGEPLEELGVYLFYVMYQIYKKAASGIRTADEADIEGSYTAYEEQILKFEHAHQRFFEQQVMREIDIQPAVIQYLVESIMEEDEEEPMTEEETGILYLTLRTAMDVLEKVAG